MATWNGLPIPDAPQIKIPNSIPQNFNWNSYKADPNGTFNKFKGARETHRLNWKGYRAASASTKKIIASSPSKRFIADAGKRIRQLKKVTDSTKKVADAAKKTSDAATKVNDALLKKVPGNAPLDKAARIGAIMGILAAIGVVALLKFQEFVTGRAFDDLATTQIDLTKVNTTAVNNGLKLKTLESKLQKYEQELSANARDYYKLNKQQESFGKNILDVKKQSNDALYETRQGRTILESKIAETRKQSNDALYETRQTKFNLEAKIQQVNAEIARVASKANDGFQNAVNTTISKLQAELASVRASIKSAPPVDTASITTSAVNAAKALVTPLQSQVGGLQATVLALTGQTAAAVAVSGVAINGVSNLAQAVSTANNTASVAQQEAESTRKYVDRVLVSRIDATVTQSTGITAEIAKLQGEAQSTRTFVERNLVPRIEATATQSTGVAAEVAEVKQQIPGLSNEIRQSQTQISDLNTKITQQAKVNEQALPKLDQIVGILGLIPGRAAAAIRPDIPTIPQIEQAAATGTCRTTQPGGCMNKALKDNAADITNNNNTNAANILDAVNTGANAALLQGQQTILARLGDQLPGGIGGKLSRFADWMHLDRVLNILIFAATVHNALMLSNDIGQTLLGAINNVLTLIGLKKEDGSSFDLGSVISGGIENLIKGAIGADNYTSLREAWAKANRIYQATTNLLNSFLNLSQTILQASELIAAYTGKIGNALKKGGVILENAYGWMNPQPKFNRVTQTLESLQNGASTIQMVTQAPLDVVNAVTESTTAATEFVKALKEDDKPVNKAAPIPEPDELKAKETQSKTDSQPLSFDFSDLFDGED
ncbi:hypothetical protein [Nostoc sp. UHCC 0251]|uniref:hypothetical protein n=1 Tax=Nostoc sp. UHCC 0251 TaxID=3110240 RepID=UPI002B2065C6|nr:hypothetical protein [Nostoc sp. UHCC 0251]MEA5624107.1 hypothetical protein [Nostoc sp. UHCC 0251]